MRTKRVLVVGSSGYIGGALCDRLAAAKVDLVCLSSSPLPVETNRGLWIHWNYDVLPNQLLALEHSPDVVYYLAGQTSAYLSNSDPVADLQASVLPFVRILDWIASRTIANERAAVIFAGSVTQHGFTVNAGQPRASRDNPDTIYDLHKQFCENYLAYYSSHHNIDGVTLRLSNVFGPGKDSRSAERGIVNRWIRGALEGSAITVFGSGEYIRDYVYIDDVVSALCDASMNASRLSGQNYEIGSGDGLTLVDAARCIVDTIFRLTGQAVPLNHIEAPREALRIENRNFVSEPSRFGAATGWHATIDFQRGVEMTCAAGLKRGKS